MQFLKELKEEAARLSAKALIGLSLLLFYKLYDHIQPYLFAHLFPNLPRELLLELLGISLSSNLLLLVCSLFLLFKNREPKLISKFGVYWDKQKNPHCPACKSLMTPFETNSLICYKCNAKNTITLRKDDSARITIAEAKTLL